MSTSVVLVFFASLVVALVIRRCVDSWEEAHSRLVQNTEQEGEELVVFPGHKFISFHNSKTGGIISIDFRRRTAEGFFPERKEERFVIGKMKRGEVLFGGDTLFIADNRRVISGTEGAFLVEGEYCSLVIFPDMCNLIFDENKRTVSVFGDPLTVVTAQRTGNGLMIAKFPEFSVVYSAYEGVVLYRNQTVTRGCHISLARFASLQENKGTRG